MDVEFTFDGSEALRMSTNKDLQVLIEEQMTLYFTNKDLLDCPRYTQQSKNFQLSLWIPYVRMHGFIGKLSKEVQEKLHISQLRRIRLLRDGVDVALSQAFVPYPKAQYRVLWPNQAPVGLQLAPNLPREREPAAPAKFQ